MDGDIIRAGVDKHRDQYVRRRDHEMHIKRLVRMRAQSLYDIRSDGEIGHIMPVHHINMNHIRPGRVNIANSLTQSREIRR